MPDAHRPSRAAAASSVFIQACAQLPSPPKTPARMAHARTLQQSVKTRPRGIDDPNPSSAVRR